MLSLEVAGDDSRSSSLAAGMTGLCDSDGLVRPDLLEDGARRPDIELGFLSDGTFLIFELAAPAAA